MKEKVAFSVGADLQGIPTFIQVLPGGKISPKGKPEMLVDAESRKEVLAKYSALQNDTVIDYEHQTLAGTQAPAAGWIKGLEDRGDGKEGGIWATVEWTEKAREYLKNREYRYLSPVVFVKKATGRVIEFVNAALTNAPAIDGMIPVVNKEGVDDTPPKGEYGTHKEAGYADMGYQSDRMPRYPLKKGGKLDPERVRAAWDSINRQEDAAAYTPEQQKEIMDKIEAAWKKCIDKNGPPSTIQAHKENAQEAQGELEQLRREIVVRDTENVIQEAMQAGKITPAMRPWADDLAGKDLEALKSFIAVAPVVVSLREFGASRLPESNLIAGSTQQEVNKGFGISAESFKKYSKRVE